MSEAETGPGSAAENSESPDAEAITTEVAMVVGAGESVPASSHEQRDNSWRRAFLRTFVCLLIPVAAGVATSWWLLRELPKAQVLDRGGTMLSSGVAARNVADAVSARVDVLRTLTVQGAVPDEIAQKNDEYRGTAEVIASIVRRVDEQWVAAYAAGTAPPRPVAEKSGSKALRSFRALFPGYMSLLAIDRYGAATASTDVPPQFDYSREAWFQNVMSSGQIELDTVFDGANRPLLSVALPLFDAARRPTGVLRAILEPAEMVSAAVDDLEAEDFSVVVLGQQGELLFRSQTGAGAAPIDGSLLEMASADDATSGARRVALGDGREVFVATALVPRVATVDVGAQLDWRVVVVRDASTLAGLVAQQKRQRMGLLTVVGGLAVGLALILSWWLSRVFRHLGEVPRIVSDRSWDQRLPGRGGASKDLVDGINGLLDRAEQSEDRRAAAAAMVEDAESLAAQAQQFSAGDRLTVFSAREPQLVVLADALKELRDDLAVRLAEVDEGLSEASDLDEQCRHDLRWTEERETDLRRAQKLLTEARSLGVALGDTADQANEGTERLQDRLEQLREDTVESQDASAVLMSSLETHRAQGAAALRRSQLQVEEIARSVSLLADLSDRNGVLALNGSIQAALAGESGRGFAVIAAELEQLSRQSIELASRTSKLIEGLEAESVSTANQLEGQEEKLVAARSLAESVGEANIAHADDIEVHRQSLAEQANSVRDAAKNSSAMALDLEEQARVIGEWKKSVDRVQSQRSEASDALSSVRGLMTKLQGRRRDRRPLSLVSPPEDLADTDQSSGQG